LQDLTEALRPEVPLEARLVLDEHVRARMESLGLDNRYILDLETRHFTKAEVDRVVELCQPTDKVTLTVLYGPVDANNLFLAISVAPHLKRELELVWISFADGPVQGWQPVAAALDIDTDQPDAMTLDRGGIPRWVGYTHERLRKRPSFLVVQDADAVPEEELGKWLPAGPGRCVVLVLSHRPEYALQRTRDAIAVRVD
jgi:hypothetical protein